MDPDIRPGSRSDRPQDGRADSEHRRASAALPWLLNGTASEADRGFVEAHLQHCDDCRAEWQQQQRWQAAMTRAPAEGNAASLPDPQAGLARLWARIDTADSAAGAAPAGRRWPLSGTHGGRLTGRAARGGRAGALVYGLLAVVMVEAVALAVLGIEVVRPGAPAALLADATTATSPGLSGAGVSPGALPGATGQAGYRTLSAAPDTTVLPGSLRVVFDGSVTLDAMQRLLVDSGLQVVAGPNQAGAFVLAPRQPGNDAAALAVRLRASPGVRLVVPVPPGEAAP